MMNLVHTDSNVYLTCISVSLLTISRPTQPGVTMATKMKSPAVRLRAKRGYPDIIQSKNEDKTFVISTEYKPFWQVFF